MPTLFRHKALTQKPEVRLTEKASPAAWQRERANRLHRKFKNVEAAMKKGVRFNSAVKFFVWFWRDRCYHSDPKRQCRFTRQTLRRLYDQWQRGGCVPSTLYPRWKPSGPSVPLAVYRRFLRFVSRVEFPTLRAAHDYFCRGRWRFGLGRPPAKQCVALTYGQLTYYFSGKLFAEIQAKRRAIETAQAEFAELCLRTDARLLQEIPERPTRKRRSRMELSLEGSQL